MSLEKISKKEEDSKYILLVLIVKAQLIRIVSWAFISNRESFSLLFTKNHKIPLKLLKFSPLCKSPKSMDLPQY